MLRRLVLGCMLLAAVPSLGWAATASLIPNGQQQFADANGVPYAGGSVCFYVPGTTTPSLTYQDPGLTVPNTSPCVTLNSAGRAIIWGSGEYRQILYNSSGTLIWDQLVTAGIGNNASVTGLACTSCTLTTTTLNGTTTISVSGTLLLPDGSSWTSSGLTPSGNPITLAALAKIATGTFLGNISGLTAAPSALSGGQVGSGLCQPQQAVKTSGSGTYTTPTCSGVTAQWLKVVQCGGGGGSGGNGTGSPGNGGTGGTTTFGGLVANGGNGSTANAAGGQAGGTASGGSLNISGAYGNSAAFTGTTTLESGGSGGSSPFGGAGIAGANAGSIPAGAASANSCSGAGGPGANGTGYATGGGGAGGWLEAFITLPSATYAYAVGAGGTAGAAGTGGLAGAAGGSGVIIIRAGWQ